MSLNPELKFWVSCWTERLGTFGTRVSFLHLHLPTTRYLSYTCARPVGLCIQSCSGFAALNEAACASGTIHSWLWSCSHSTNQCHQIIYFRLLLHQTSSQAQGKARLTKVTCRCMNRATNACFNCLVWFYVDKKSTHCHCVLSHYQYLCDKPTVMLLYCEWFQIRQSVWKINRLHSSLLEWWKNYRCCLTRDEGGHKSSSALETPGNYKLWPRPYISYAK